MALSKLYTDYALKVDAATAQSGGAAYLDGVKSLSFANRLATLVEAGDGEVSPSFGSLARGDVTAEVTTLGLKAALDILGAAGQLVDADGSHPGVVLYFRRMAQGGTRDAYNAGTHWAATVPNGLLVPRRLSAQSGANATLDLELVARKAGSTAPVAFDEAANLPNRNAGPDVVWTIGPVDLNATRLDGLESVEVDFGIEVVAERKDSDVYPSFVSIKSIAPKVRVRGAHLDVTSTLTEDGAYYTAAQVILYLRKRSEGGTFVADATAGHLKLTLGKCRVEPMSIGGDPKSIELEITPWATPGSVTPLAVNTGSAIP